MAMRCEGRRMTANRVLVRIMDPALSYWMEMSFAPLVPLVREEGGLSLCGKILDCMTTMTNSHNNLQPQPFTATKITAANIYSH